MANWIDGYGQLGTNTTPLYGTSLDNLFLDAINDAYLEQFLPHPLAKITFYTLFSVPIIKSLTSVLCLVCLTMRH